MNDILCELRYLSEALQKRDMNILLADKKIKQAIRCIQGIVDKQEVQLHRNSRMKRIIRPQLVMSVVNKI